MQIGEVARAAEVSVDTIRFYERRGVLPPPARRPSGYRVYGPATVERIRLARALQNIGFTLTEIIDALHRMDLGDATCATERWRLEAVLARIDAQMAELERVKRDVNTVLVDCDAGECRFGLASASPS
jgi:DNA-binding transcriptional MerR regulator